GGVERGGAARIFPDDENEGDGAILAHGGFKNAAMDRGLLRRRIVAPAGEQLVEGALCHPWVYQRRARMQREEVGERLPRKDVFKEQSRSVLQWVHETRCPPLRSPCGLRL
ncbi:MAG: hypothetical protein ACI9KE_004718, partial [Polyangiales bacterium]